MKDIIKRIITFFVIIIIIRLIHITICMIKHKYYIKEKRKHMINYKDIKGSLKTGDIILFSIKQHKSFFHEMFYFARTSYDECQYGHSGIIIVKDGIPYVAESNIKSIDENIYHLTNHDNGGVRLVQLDYFLNKYNKKHKSTFAIKPIEKELSTDITLNILQEYKKYHYPNLSFFVTVSLLRLLTTLHLTNDLYLLAYQQNKDTLMCSEFVYHFLNKYGVLKEYPSKIFWVKCITDGTLDDLTHVNHKYGQLYSFKTD